MLIFLRSSIAYLLEIYAFDANISKSKFPGNSRDPGKFVENFPVDREIEKTGKLKTLCPTHFHLGQLRYNFLLPFLT